MHTYHEFCPLVNSFFDPGAEILIQKFIDDKRYIVDISTNHIVDKKELSLSVIAS